MKIKTIIITIFLLASTWLSFGQKTIFGVVSNSSQQTLQGVVVGAISFSDSTLTNERGEYQLVVPDSCNTLVFSFGANNHTEAIDERTIINVILPKGEKSKTMLSTNPRNDYPYGVQLTLAGHSLFAVAFNYFINQKQSVEIGICGRGLEIGTRRYFPLNDYGQNKALYLGAITNVSLGGDFVLYLPFGYHILSHNGMAFGIEVGGKTPLYIDDNTNVFDFLGFGINFGFQF